MIGGVRPPRSVFVRLMAIMVAMAIAVPAIVGGTFLLGLQPSLDRMFAGQLDATVELLAARDPGLEEARAAAARYALDVRYEGPRGAWATGGELPRPGAPPPSTAAGAAWRCGVDCRGVLRPDGGVYLFVSRQGTLVQRLHDALVVALVVVLVGLIVVGHEILRRTLWPLHTLYRGVVALSAGDLEVELPRVRPDELGALADAFNRMVAQVREMLRARDQLLLDVSHELRSPLTRMRVALALQPEGEARARLERNVLEMETKVTELLELERLRAGRGLALAPHDLVEVVRDAVLAFGGRPPGVELAEAPATAPATLDPDQVRSVMNNLLENAIRHALPDSAPIRVAVRTGEGGAEVVVADDGPGVPAEDLPHLFEPFYRVDRSRSRRTGGYGLGLALCQRIMEAHGGGIVVRNRPGRGCEVVLSFPARDLGAHVRERG